MRLFIERTDFVFKCSLCSLRRSQEALEAQRLQPGCRPPIHGSSCHYARFPSGLLESSLQRLLRMYTLGTKGIKMAGQHLQRYSIDESCNDGERRGELGAVRLKDIVRPRVSAFCQGHVPLPAAFAACESSWHFLVRAAWPRCTLRSDLAKRSCSSLVTISESSSLAIKSVNRSASASPLVLSSSC